MIESALPAREPDSWWVAILGDEEEGENGAASRDFVLARSRRGRTLRLRGEPRACWPAHATCGSLAAVWAGVLYDPAELARDLPCAREQRPNAAALVLAAYRAWGEEALRAVRGTFALVLWDAEADVLLCARDPMGHHPVFHAETGRSLAISDSIDSVLDVGGVSRAPSRAAVAVHLASLPMQRELTFFSAVRRIPPGHVLRAERSSKRVYRYWDPAPPGEDVDWVTPEETERFTPMFDRAVERCQRRGPAAIFLSGGLDSGSIAAVAVENSRRLGLPSPTAFSLLFPDPECNEEAVQRGMAAALGIEHVALPFDDALAGRGLLAPALEASRRLPAPLDNFWLPAYYALALQAKHQGLQCILTGTGGDEWLSVTPVLAADLIPKLDVAALYRLWGMLAASYKIPRLAMTRNLLWECGLRPALGGVAASALARWAPALLHAKRRAFRRIPAWFSGDARLREEIEASLEPVVPASEVGGYYLRELRIALDHYLVSMELEEDFEVARRGGLERMHPFLDPDLLDLLFRTPPELLCRGGRAKGLVRSMLAERFPTLGYERQRKVSATNFSQSRLFPEAKRTWAEFGSPVALIALGVVDEKRLRLTLQRAFTQNDARSTHHIWAVLSMESWLRARSP